jgi:hypothetical protein
VWCPLKNQWKGFGALSNEDLVKCRNGLLAVTHIEKLNVNESVYNIEIAGENVYEITDNGILVHNVEPWNCSEFLELRAKYLKNPKSLGKNQLARYNELAQMVRDFRKHMDPEDLKALENLKPDEVDTHLHHILAKLAGSKELATRVVEIQKILWEKHGIDPFMSTDIFVYAPNRGVHSHEAIEYVVKQLEEFFKKPRSLKEVQKKLRQLGEWAAQGGISPT